MLRVIALLSVLALAACQPAPVGVHNLSVARDSGGQCVGLCQQVGMSLDSLVIMADNVGCVCRALPPPAAPPGAELPPAPAATTGAASAGGMAAIMIQREAQAAAARRSAAQRK